MSRGCCAWSRTAWTGVTGAAHAAETCALPFTAGRDRPRPAAPKSPDRRPLRPLGLGCLAVLSQLGQRGGQLAAGADAELGEYLAQVPLDRPRGQEQPGADLRISQAVARQPGDEGFLRGQRGDGL